MVFSGYIKPRTVLYRLFCRFQYTPGASVIFLKLLS